MAEPTDDVQLPQEFIKLSTLIEEHPEYFAFGSKDIQVAALDAAKYIFDLGKQFEKKFSFIDSSYYSN